MQSLTTQHTTNENGVAMWDCDRQLTEIRKIYAPTATENEFKCFIQLGKMTGLNPFLKQIWIIKYGNAPAQMFIARDGYRISAIRNPAYDCHQVESVYSNDDFSIQNGLVSHRFANLSDRGKLCGAYAIVWKKTSTKPNYVYVDINEYNTKKSVWSEKPSTMIKKVAEAQVLRLAFPEMYAGTYNEYENYIEENRKLKDTNKKLLDMLNNKGNYNESIAQQDGRPEEIIYSETNINRVENNRDENSNSENHIINQYQEEIVQAPTEEISQSDLTEELLSPAQEEELHTLIYEKNLSLERLAKALLYYGANNISQLTIEQAKEFINILKKIEIMEI